MGTAPCPARINPDASRSASSRTHPTKRTEEATRWDDAWSGAADAGEELGSAGKEGYAAVREASEMTDAGLLLADRVRFRANIGTATSTLRSKVVLEEGAGRAVNVS